MPKNTDLAVTNSDVESQFPVLAISPAQLQAELEDTMAGEELSPANIDKLKIPTGGMTLFTLPSVGGEQEDVRVVKGVVLFGHYMRTYWESQFGSGEAAPPNCSSPDAHTGIGEFGYGSEKNPSGQCSSCPMSDWLARDPKNPARKTQACKLNYLVYLLLPGLRFPVQLKLPPTSLNQKDNTGWRNYIKGLANRGLSPYSVVTEIGLRQAQTPNGTKYSVATFKVGEPLTAEEAARARAYAESLKPIFVPGPAGAEGVDFVESVPASDGQQSSVNTSGKAPF